MTKLTVYLRIGKRETGSYAIAASASPNPAPLKDNSGAFLPTVSFGVRVSLPDSAFENRIPTVAGITVPEEAMGVLRAVGLEVDTPTRKGEEMKP